MGPAVTRVHIVDDFQRDGHDVYVLSRQLGQMAILRADGEWEALDPAAQEQAAPTLRLPEGALDAIVAQAQGLQPRAAAVEDVLRDALTDARGVRDRVLDGLAVQLHEAR